MSQSSDIPVAIDRVDRARGEGDGIRLRLSGRRLRALHGVDEEPLLVIQLQGRRHRFVAEPPPANASLAPGAWEATFTVPAWAEPQRPGQAAVWLGSAVVPVPLPGEGSASVSATPVGPPAQHVIPPALGEARPAGQCPTPADDSETTVESAEPIVDTGRTGPLAELLFKENVGALHAELEQRAGEVARLRGALADAQSQLTARATTQAALEVAHAELRSELQKLMAAASGQREDFARRLREADVEAARLRDELEAERGRSATASEELSDRLSAERERFAAELSAERERFAAELSAERERFAAELSADRGRFAAEREGLAAERDRLSGEVAALRAELDEVAATRRGRDEDVSALREQLAGAQVARDASAGEVEGLRIELERLGTELAVAREQLSAQGGDLGEAQRLLADARALTDQLRGQNPQ